MNEIERIYDYRFNTQFYETRVQSLLETQWLEFGTRGYVTSREYVFAVSYEG